MTDEAIRRRRAVARATHPDAGGSHEAFIAAMASDAPAPHERRAVTVVVRHPVRRRVTHVLRSLRHRLPRRRTTTIL
ncbi:hypothetical protein ACHAAC_03650 [Aeromicrobium sp. CF4.19]|uniref:hypothetical protein n=1 Tax=Aeromicrobium sp. CF4.19 TaxID=3373082 RepID=UPI003EE57DC8